MSEPIDAIGQDIGGGLDILGADMADDFLGGITSGNMDNSAFYPRIDSQSEIIGRSLAISDNLDEIILLPQGMVFPLKPRYSTNMRRRISKLDSTTRYTTRRGRRRDQSESFDEYDDHQL